MATDLDKIWVFRIIPIQNLENILREGMFCKSAGKNNTGFVTIGSEDVISRRDTTIVKCYPDSYVNDYVPFYFSVRTPMLYNIITGHGVPAKPQDSIIYLCCELSDLASDKFQWCYTNGNAAAAITRFYTTLQNVDKNIDWHSIYTTDFRDENADGDEDRIRKKHAEFLVKGHVPVEYIKVIVVLNDQKAIEVKSILDKLDLNIKVHINQKFYFV